MKIAYVVILSTLLCVGCKEKEGRYVLQSASVHAFVSGTNGLVGADMHTMFKIDTTTGKTWFLMFDIPKPYWQEVTDARR